MFYFYYFQCYKTQLYYGGITNNVLKRQTEHQIAVNNNTKSNKKPWHLYQDKIKLVVLWSFESRFQASIYEKQWIINNYLNPLCLNCSVSNSEYSYGTLKHKELCEAGGGCKAKIKYALEVNNSEKIYTFQSSVKAAIFTKVLRRNINYSCKNSQPVNSESGRWLFSDISIEDLRVKFNNLTKLEITGFKNRKFILIDKNTQQKSRVFNGVYEPIKSGYTVNQGHLSACLLGRRRSVNGYYVGLCI